jgi:hypothetical protein
LEVKGIIETLLLHEFDVGAGLLDDSVFEIIDPVRQTDCGETVGGKEDSLAVEFLTEV